MSEEKTVNLPIASLEVLRCFICKGYLSCSPLCFLTDGNCICGRCSPLNAETPVHRLVCFESFLCKLSFPCVFMKNGCMEMLRYGETADHESKCVYKSVACPMNSIASCEWKGVASQFLPHFNDKHPDVLKNNVAFKLEVGKDAQDVLIAFENSLPFILKYFYCADTKILKYNIIFCSSQNGFEGFFQIQLMNGLDSDCNMNLKMDNCCSYDENFSEMQNAKVLNLNKFLECLGDPNCIAVAMKLKVVKSNGSNVPYEDHYEIHSDLIKSLRCYVCHNYLVPPLFHSNDKPVCYDCAKRDSSYKPLDDAADLVERVNKAMYPCRWRDCNVLSKCNDFKNHDVLCQFRQYGCVFPCNITFKLSAATDHTSTLHDAICVTGGVKYATSFTGTNAHENIITIKNNRIIRVGYWTGPSYHCISLHKSPEDNAKATGIVVLEHVHCRLKSKEFILNVSQELIIYGKDLPSCFNIEDKFSVSVELIA